MSFLDDWFNDDSFDSFSDLETLENINEGLQESFEYEQETGTSSGLTIDPLTGAVIIGAAYLLQAYAPGRDEIAESFSSSSSRQRDRGILLNKESNDEPIPVVYGTRRVGGSIVFKHQSGSNNEYLNLVIVICEGEIEAIDTVLLDGEDSTDSKFSGFVDVYKHLGVAGEAADANLISELPTKWTSDHKLGGLAYVYIRLKFDSTVMNRQPLIQFDIRGRKVYDTRTSTTAFSNNPALCFRDYLTNTLYGRGLDASLIDDTQIDAVANTCEEQVTAATGNQDRYTCDGVVSTDQTHFNNLKRLLTCCRGFLSKIGGNYVLKVDESESSSFDFDEDNITGGWGFSLGGKSQQVNRMIAYFANPDKNWERDPAIVDSTALRTIDNNALLERDTDLPFTTNIYRAKQIATINLNQLRKNLVVEFTATPEALQVEAGDVVTVTHSVPGWSSKEFRVISLKLTPDTLIKVTLLEYDSDVYDFGIINAVDSVPGTTLPRLNDVDAPGALTATETLYTTLGTTKVKAVLSWGAATEAFIKDYIFEHKLSTDSDWNVHPPTPFLTGEVLDVAPGTYDFRVKSRNIVDGESTYSTTQVSIAGLTTLPAVVTGLGINIISNQAHLFWDAATDLDVTVGGYFRVKHSPKTTGATWSDGIDIGTKVSGVLTQTVLPLLVGTYMIKAVDSTGNASQTMASLVRSKSASVIEFDLAVVTVNESSFSGTPTNMEVVGGILRISPEGTTLDNITSNIDTWVSIDFVNGVLSSGGDYVFANTADLGKVLTGRVTIDVTALGVDIGSLFDSDELFDSTDLFDDADIDAVNAELFVRTTDDDPGVSPTWSSYEKFYVGDYTARGFQFKLVATTTSTQKNIEISGLSVDIDLPEKVDKGASVAISSGGTAISFSKNFYSTPSINVSPHNLASGDYQVITSISATGFTLQFKDSGGTGVARTTDWTAIGF